MTLAFVDAALKVSLLAVAALVAAALLRKHAAALRHRVLAASFLCMAAVPLLAMAVPAWTLPAGLVVTALQPNRAASAPGTEASPTVVPMAEAEAAEATRPQEHAALPPRGHDGPPVATALDHVVPLWIAGAAAHLFVLFAGLGRLGWLSARSTPIHEGPWRTIADTLSRRYGLRRTIRLLRSGHPTLLVTWGSLRPTVILPLSSASWGPERIEIVLAHELGHVRRGDWAVQIAAGVVRALYWFNPLVWIACARLVREAEHACDDGVLNMGVEGKAYATQLLELARAFSAYRRTWSPAPAVVRPSSLERRVQAMLSPRINRRPVSRAVSAGVVLAALCLAGGLAGLQVFAQSFSMLSGVVLDPHGRPVADATVVLSNESRRSKYEVMSNEAGRFEFTGLHQGDYVLAAERSGFTPFQERLTIDGGDLHREIPMQLGTLQETVVVGGASTAEERRAVHTVNVKVADEARRRLQRARETCGSASDHAATGGNVRPPIKVKHVAPIYPAHLRSAGVSGVVKLKARVASDGQVAEIQPISPEDHPELIAAASEAVSQWQFEPTLLNCVPSDVLMNVAIEFRRQPPPPPASPPGR